jgi:hypothetical protein
MIDFTKEEKDLILAAIEIKKGLQEMTEDGHLEEMEELEEEMKKETVYLSRSQLEVLFEYLGVLLDRKKEYSQIDVMLLGNKLEKLMNQP